MHTNLAFGVSIEAFPFLSEVMLGFCCAFGEGCQQCWTTDWTAWTTGLVM